MWPMPGCSWGTRMLAFLLCGQPHPVCSGRGWNRRGSLAGPGRQGGFGPPSHSHPQSLGLGTQGSLAPKTAGLVWGDLKGSSPMGQT